MVKISKKILLTFICYFIFPVFLVHASPDYQSFHFEEGSSDELVNQILKNSNIEATNGESLLNSKPSNEFYFSLDTNAVNKPSIVVDEKPTKQIQLKKPASTQNPLVKGVDVTPRQEKRLDSFSFLKSQPSYLRSLLAFGVVLVSFLGALYFVRKRKIPGLKKLVTSKNSPLQIEQVLSLGVKKTLHLIKCQGHQLLIFSNADNAQCVWSSNQVLKNQNQVQQEQGAQNLFSSLQKKSRASTSSFLDFDSQIKEETLKFNEPSQESKKQVKNDRLKETFEAAEKQLLKLKELSQHYQNIANQAQSQKPPKERNKEQQNNNNLGSHFETLLGQEIKTGSVNQKNQARSSVFAKEDPSSQKQFSLDNSKNKSDVVTIDYRSDQGFIA